MSIGDCWNMAMFGIVHDIQRARGGAIQADTFKVRPLDCRSSFDLLPEGTLVSNVPWFKG